MISKKDLIARGMYNPEISPEVQKMTDGMVERWERLGIKFDNQAANPNTEVEKRASRVMEFTHLINPKRRLNK